MKSKIIFADNKVKKTFEKLSKSNKKELYNSITKSFNALKNNVFRGIQIPKKQIPKEYLRKYKIDNLWKVNLSHSWRLIYSVSSQDVVIIYIILEWMNHKEYDRKFKY